MNDVPADFKTSLVVLQGQSHPFNLPVGAYAHQRPSTSTQTRQNAQVQSRPKSGATLRARQHIMLATTPQPIQPYVDLEKRNPPHALNFPTKQYLYLFCRKDSDRHCSAKSNVSSDRHRLKVRHSGKCKSELRDKQVRGSYHFPQAAFLPDLAVTSLTSAPPRPHVPCPFTCLHASLSTSSAPMLPYPLHFNSSSLFSFISFILP